MVIRKVKKEYMDKVKEILKKLGKKHRKLNILKKEIAVLKSREIYKEIDFKELGFKTHKSTKGIDDIVITIENEIFNKESEIEYIEKKISLLKLYLDELAEEEQEIIRMTYFYNWSRKDSLVEMAFKMHCHKDTIYYKRENAIQKLAEMMYGEEALK